VLVSLSVRDVVLIDRLSLTFGGGLCALTGETGAGKSILLDALGLALGARADARLLRPGAERVVVAANFAPPAGHAVHRLLDEHGLDGDDELVLRRVVTADGRGRAFVNDQPVGVALMREIGASLVEIQGQASQRGLLGGEGHRVLLDAFGGHHAAVANLAERCAAWRAARDAHARALAALDEARRDEAHLRHAVAELETLAPVAGEEAELAARRRRLMAGEKIAEAVRATIAELTEGGGVEGHVHAAQRLLDRVAGDADRVLDGALAALDRTAVELVEALAALEAAGRSLAPDPERLARVEERLFGLRAAARKHDTDVDSLAGLLDKLRQRLALLEDRDHAVEALAVAAASARADFETAVRAVSEARAKAARALDRRVAKELPALKLGASRFVTRLDPLAEADWSAAGGERVRFEIATVPGAEPGPLGRIASGGELSRLLLALRVVLADADTVPTLVFDEVDSGIGGAVAAAVGERLARLGEAYQVLVVTHSPQVAARAGHHYRVVKDEAGGALFTRVDALSDGERREEVARMLAGARVTDAARAAADSLLHAGAG